MLTGPSSPRTTIIWQDVLSGGFPKSLSEDAVLELENAYVPFSRILAGKVEDVVLPQRD